MSLYFDFFMQNLLCVDYEKILLLAAIIFLGITLREYPHGKQFTVFICVQSKKGFGKMMHDLVEKSRIKIGRNANPSYSLIDSKSSKTTDKAVS
ncbi:MULTISPECIES: hypothetical protein [unclassified Legionella]|uniref:hypothetical protein n=1 Tax=unclassified Legionella TaxID=2622702 RepID=UPI0010564589|nr:MULTISPECIES: hypothetical protein [unclassified Legionella]MDI9819493.1 hypothetical protein [Legionella sp. PL877]